jgi:hypothetical protein
MIDGVRRIIYVGWLGGQTGDKEDNDGADARVFKFVARGSSRRLPQPKVLLLDDSQAFCRSKLGKLGNSAGSKYNHTIS